TFKFMASSFASVRRRWPFWIIRSCCPQFILCGFPVRYVPLVQALRPAFSLSSLPSGSRLTERRNPSLGGHLSGQFDAVWSSAQKIKAVRPVHRADGFCCQRIKNTAKRLFGGISCKI